MEIEAKFAVPDAETFDRLQAVERLADLSLSPGQVQRVRDTYLDTPEGLILGAGYACRWREHGEGVLISLKGLGEARDAVHRRQEIQASLPLDPPKSSSRLAPSSLLDWPAGPLRQRVQALVGDTPLLPLFSLRQKRIVRQISQGERPVAELSLDTVRLDTGGPEPAHFELEVELSAQGTEDDLAAICAHLQDTWSLSPELQSKFERLLARLLESSLLTPPERILCHAIATRFDLYGRRAAALLALDQGATQVKAGKRVGVSDRTVRNWLSAFRHKRLGVFPRRVLDSAQSELAALARLDANQAQARSELGRLLFEAGVRFQAVEMTPVERGTQIRQLAGPTAPLPAQPGLELNDSTAEAARKTLYFHFERMLYHEPGTRLGADTEELHDMRVATRRMRTAFQVFGDYMTQVNPFVQGLRRAGRALGAVRDLDVFWEKTQHYLDTLPPDRMVDLSPLRNAWEVQHERARERMLTYLDSEDYVRFKEQFGQFLQTPGAGARPALSPGGNPLPHRLRHTAPVLIYRRLAAVQAFDEWVTGPHVRLDHLHQLRIAAKRLRYTVEYLREVLKPEARNLIREIKILQDHLGDLQDAVVASDLLRNFLTSSTWGRTANQQPPVSAPEPIAAPGVSAYLSARQTELEDLVETFPQIWARFHGSEFSQLVASVVAGL